MTSLLKMTILCLGLFVAVFAQAYKAPLKYGKPSIEQVSMKIYGADSTANAVVLCSYGYFNSNTFTFTNTQRIKILKESGTDEANVSFYTSYPGEASVRGKTFNLVDGKIVASKLKGESIFKTKIIGNYHKISVAMPNVKVGSVIDIQFSQPGVPSSWYFQRLIPVAHSELILEPSTYIDYKKTPFGYISLNAEDNMRWYSDNIPAFKIEPFMDSYENYISKFEFELARISFPNFYKEYATTWNDAVKVLSQNNYFGVILRAGNGYLKDLANEIKEKHTTPADRARAAYDAIKQVKWNDVNSVYTSTNSLGSVFKKKLGNSADINILLLKLLTAVDIKAAPVVLSPREDGYLSPFTPSLNKLDYLICCAVIDDREVLMDATEPYLPMGLLPDRAINERGRLVISSTNNRWVKLSPKKKEYTNSFYQLTLDANGVIKGRLQKNYIDYSAYIHRKEIASYNSEESYLADIESENKGVTIINYQKTDKDLYTPLREKYEVECRKSVEQFDDLMMVNMFFFNQKKKNALTAAKRNYPVKYTHCQLEKVTTQLTIPEGYTVSELPKPAIVKLPENGGMFIVAYQQQGNVISMSFTMKLNKMMYSQIEYPYLKEFYNQLIKKEAEPVILKKS